jgi:hypothetical protein
VTRRRGKQLTADATANTTVDLMHRKQLMMDRVTGRLLSVARLSAGEDLFFQRSLLQTAMSDASRLQERDCLFGAR